MKKRIYRRILSGVLTVTTLFTQYGGMAKAYSETDTEASSGSVSDDQENIAAPATETIDDQNEEMVIGKKEEATIVSEIVDARDEFSKQYLMSDNSKSVVIYSEPVHYMNEDGTYTEIDNSVKKTDEGYENVDNTYNVVFTDNEESRGEVRFAEDEYQINWEYIDENVLSEDIKEADEDKETEYETLSSEPDENGNVSISEAETDELLQNPETDATAADLDVTVEHEDINHGEEETIGHVINSSTVTYDGYSGGVRLEYSPTSLGVKENIILSGRESGNEFSFRIQLFGLKARVNSANEVELFDENTDRVKYYFPAPFMKDAKEKESYEVWYSLSDTAPVPKIDEISGEDRKHEDVIPEPVEEDQSDKSDKTEEETGELSDEIEDCSDLGEVSDPGDSEAAFSDEESDPYEDIMTDLDEDLISESSDELSDDASRYNSEGISNEMDIEEAKGTEDVTISEDGYIYLTLTADEDWLDNATYPVTIDPIVTIARDNVGIKGCSVNSNVDEVNHNLGINTETLYVGKEKFKSNGKYIEAIHRAYIKFDLPNIENGSIVTDAQLYLRGAEVGKNKHYLVARKNIDYWDVETIGNTIIQKNESWLKALPGTDPRILDYAVNGGHFDITKAVRDWYAAPKTNYGLEFSAYDEKYLQKDGINLLQDENKPYLKISFRHYVGLENYWASHSTAVGTSGMGYINDYTGALTVVNTAVNTEGLRMPFNIQLVYNSNWEEGWKFSYDERIEVPSNELDVKTYPYVYTDGDGTKHYFKAQNVTYQENGKKKTASKTPSASVGYPAAADEDGLKLFIVPVTDSRLKDKYPLKLLDQSGSGVKYFDMAGHLAEISDSNRYENGKNDSEKVANKITISLGKYGDIKPVDKYTEALDILSAMYDYSKLDMESVSDADTYYENKLKVNALLGELLNDDYAKADYLIAKKVQLAHDTISGLVATGSPSKKRIQNDCKTAKEAMASACEQAKVNRLYDERIIAVTDAAGKCSEIEYHDATGYIYTISDPTKKDADAKNEYKCDQNGRITDITFSNGKTASYEYDSDGNLICMQDSSGYKVKFTYKNGKVVEVHEWSGAVEGQTYTIKYNDDNTTAFRFSGIDDIYGNNDDVINTYVFDEKGRVISAYSTNLDDTNGDGVADNNLEVYGANACTYEDTAAKQVARTSYDDQSPERYPNLLKNPGFELESDDWKPVNPDHLKDNKIVIDNNPNESYLESKSLVMTSTDDEYVMYEQKIELDPGDYVISYRIKTESKGGLICPYIRYEDIDFSELKDPKVVLDDDKWLIVALKFNLTEKKEYYAGLCVKNAKARFDCVHLETGSTPHNYSTTSVLSSSANEEKKESDPTVRNKIKDSAVTGRQTQNLLRNHNFENDDDSWEKYITEGTGKNKGTAVSTSSTRTPYIGKKSLSMNMNKLGKGEAGAKQTVRNLKPGNYTLSAYTKVTTKDAATSAYLKVQYTHLGKLKEDISEILSETSVNEIENGWTRLKVTFTLDSQQHIIVAAEGICNKEGTSDFVVFDCIQLETGKIANEYNILEDGDFELTEDVVPYSWKNITKGDHQDEIISNGGIDGGKCYHITGEPGRDKYLRFTAQLGDETASYVFSGFVKTKTTPVRKGRELRVRAYHSGSKSKFESSLTLNDYSDGWRYFTLIMPAHAWNDTSISIDFFDNIGDLYIDSLQLSKSDISTKTFNSEGRVTGVATVEKQTTYEYDGFGRMSKMVTAGGVSQKYTYNTSNENTKIEASLGPNSYMTYDEYGNQLSVSAHKAVTYDENGNPNKQLELYTTNTYVSKGNYLASTTGTNSAVTTYDYDETTGLLMSEEGPKYNCIDLETMSQGLWGKFREALAKAFEEKQGIKFDYVYDDLGRIQKVTCRSENGNSRIVTYDYEKGGFSDLKSISHNGFKYEYEYDGFGNLKQTSIAGVPVTKNEYYDYNGSLKYTEYADGSTKKVEYDTYGNITGEVTALENQGAQTTDSYSYYNNGNLAVHTDRTVKIDKDGNDIVEPGLTTEYDYNVAGKVSRSTVRGKISGVDQYSRLQYTYNTQGKVQVMSYEVAEGEDKKLKTYNYNYAADGLSTKDTLPDGSTKEYKYDSLRRSTNVIYSPKTKASGESKLYTSATFASGRSSSKNLIGTDNSLASYSNKIGTKGKKTENTYEYKHDHRGNICAIDEFNTAPGKKTHATGNEDYERIYQYDSFGEVVRAREIFGNGESLEYSYEYDDGGNITDEEILDLNNKDKNTNKKTRTYEYDTKWRDKLISYSEGEGVDKVTKTISYDACGNPTEYLGKNMVWNAVNNSLTSISFKEGNKDKIYFYNYLSDGQRLSKTVDEKTTIYIYNAGMLLAEDNPDYRINYYYDASGIATEIGYSKKDNGKYAKEEYFFFTRNGQGDIVGIYRSSDSKRMGTYEYDLWGNPVTIEATADDSLGITEKNPLRYRGYYYDRETKFYYLNARYYDPEIHRFISTDSVIAGVSSDVLGYNLFTYCDNDPVNKIDTTGNWPKLTNKQKIAVGLAVIAVAAVLTVATGGAAAGTVVAAVNCFATGALQGAVIGAATGAVSGAAINGGIAFVTSGFDLEKTKQAAIDGACDGFMSGAITGFVTGGMTSSHCFVAGTLVETIDGPIPIEQIEEGEFVLSEDPETGDVTYKRVLETYVNETTELIHLNIDGEEIVTTPAHPFYVKNIGFVLAGDLEEGTTLVDNEGNELHLLIKRWEQLQSAVPVYNFAVEDYHTYFVGNNYILVHNSCYTKDVNGRWHRPNGQFASNAEMGIENPVKTVSTHGNSLSYPGKNYGYVLKDKTTGEVLKYGESINPFSRYTQAYLDSENAVMEVIKEGSKAEIHQWQRVFNDIYSRFAGQLPRLSVYGW